MVACTEAKLKIECAHDALVEPHKLVPHPKNPHKHTPEQIDRLAKIIDFQGQRSPITVSSKSGFIVAGHGRLQAMQKLGWEKVAVDYQDFPDEAAEYAHIVADNAIGKDGWAELDLSQINVDFLDMGPDLDLDMLGLKDFVVEPLDKLEPQSDEDEVPEVKHAITRRGDIWLLGKHRVMCGDSTMINDVEKLMGGERADMVFTDPPYGVSYSGGHNEEKRDGIKGDKLEGVDLTDLFYLSLQNAEIVTKDKCAFYVWFASGKSVEVFSAFAKLSLKVRAVIAWYKIKSGLGDFMSQYIPNYEPCIYALKENGITKWNGPTNEKTVWELKKESKNEYHPTQKPVELSERAITNSTDSGDLVFDCFLGSGATIIGAEKTGRKCFGMEIDEHYCDVIINRWQKYTGKEATLELTGQSYAQLKEERDAQNN